MDKRREERVEYQDKAFYEDRVQRKSVVFILAIMFGTGGGLQAGSKMFKLGSIADSVDDLDNILGNTSHFWHEAPAEWVELWRHLLFEGLNS
jgi:hypothetical protein